MFDIRKFIYLFILLASHGVSQLVVSIDAEKSASAFDSKVHFELEINILNKNKGYILNI